ncbi:tetratricopeptide repeat protein [Massilia sp. SM-13]|uniref:tetratricopeptide repeat protein n=1 Tax=Pseudoduganella rhizocola TaxID=3382643 RepID=UPI0038B41E4D
MANREELAVIRGARSGDPACQLKLGQLYLFGGASLPRSMPTALHWLSRAAGQGQDAAWRLIGQHIAFEYAQHSRAGVLDWYVRAAEAGIHQAAITLAQLILLDPPLEQPALRERLAPLLDDAAQHGQHDARWLLAQLRPVPSRTAPPPASCPLSEPRRGWPADAGAEEAQYVLLEQIWQEQERSEFLQCALPLARCVLAEAPADAMAWQGTPAQVSLLSRCAEALGDAEFDEEGEQQRMRELAAFAGDRNSQLVLGLALARMNCEGERLPSGSGTVNFKRAIRWLTQAGEQGLADAWYALSRIYVKPEFSQRSVSEAQACLERAADMGHSGAQLECGMQAWRTRRGDELNDVRAAYWLQKAAAQGSAEAQAALDRIAPPPPEAGWAEQLLPLLTRELFSSQPLLAARIELACTFNLTRAEALLLDVKSADQGHCLVVDIRAAYGRSKRRLVLVRNAQQRQALDRIARLFEQVDCSLAGPEGNYRQRLYRFKTWLLSTARGTEALAA